MTALRGDVGRRGELTDHPDSPDRSQDRDLEPRSGRLLSVAALQQALQVARAAPPPVPASPPGVSPSPMVDGELPPIESDEAELTIAVHVAVDAEAGGDVGRSRWRHLAARPGRPPVPGLRPIARSGPARDVPLPAVAGAAIAVLGAHGGAGASTVALALADAAAAQGRGVRLISCAPPARCGLLAVSSVEFGISIDGQWLRGRRGSKITVERPTGSDPASNWPGLADARSAAGPLRILDVAPTGEQLPASLVSAVVVVLVFRVNVPGVQRAERVLGELQQLAGSGVGGSVVLLAGVGPRRWPGVVTASVGPLLRQHQRDGHLVAIPFDRALERTGLTSSPLPNAIGKAAARLLRLAEPAMTSQPTATTRPVATAHSDSRLTPPTSLRPAAAAGRQPGEFTCKDSYA